MKNFYDRSEQGRMAPRAVFLDLEPNAIDAIKTGKYRNFYDENSFIGGKELPSTLFSQAISAAKHENYLTDYMDGIRKQAEKCESLQGFQMFCSAGGGTGSGLGSLILSLLSDLYKDKPKLVYAMYPCDELSQSVVEPYNSVLLTDTLIEHGDVNFMIENQAVYNMCRDKLRVERPTYSNLNRLIAQVISSLTVSLRFDSDLNVEINEY